MSTTMGLVPSLSIYILKLGALVSYGEKVHYLLSVEGNQEKWNLFPKEWLLQDEEKQYVLLCYLTLHTKEQLTCMNFTNFSSFMEFLEALLQIEKFYQALGGILGYQQEVLKLIYPEPAPSYKKITYSHPVGWNLEKENPLQVYDGLLSLSSVAELYPVGGAGDRLDLRDPKTSEPLPCACLIFLGKTLIERLFRDLFGREYLYYKVLGEQIVTPVGLMTSQEKNNTAHMTSLLESLHYFERPKNSVRLFEQPLAPMVSKEGVWVVSDEWQLLKKPGGHGVLWKVAWDQGVFSWFLSLGKVKGMVRQINNPVACVDSGYLRFCGIGSKEDKKFGFLSCPRRAGSPEGMDVLTQESTSYGWVCGITNIEYTDFVKKGIEDSPNADGFSLFPSNTNILYFDVEQVAMVCQTNPFPGLVFNPKTPIELPYEGVKELRGGRLESAMQNIADDFMDLLPEPIGQNQWKNLSTFIAYQSREKTISVTKKKWEAGQAIHDTPVGAFYDWLLNAYNLLLSCGLTLPKWDKTFDPNDPPFLFNYHPALGPIYRLIQQKIQGGDLALGSEVVLEIAELGWNNVSVDGSLIVEAENICGHLKDGRRVFSEQVGQCYLDQVSVINEGFKKGTKFWEGEVERNEALSIHIEGNGQFIARHVTFKGNQSIHVPDQTQVIATQKGEVVHFEKKPVTHSLFATELLPNKEIVFKINI